LTGAFPGYGSPASGYLNFAQIGYGHLPPGTTTISSSQARGGSPVKSHGPFPSLILAFATLLMVPVRPLLADVQTQNPSPTPANAATVSAEERGDIFMARQQYLAAIDAYRQAPVTAVTLNKLGIAYHHLFALDEARRDYEKALLIRPNYPEALNNLGAADFVQGHYKQSIKLYRKALRLMPHSAVIAANLGTAYFARGKYTNGLESYQTAFRLDPTVFDGDHGGLIQGPTDSHDRARQDYCLAELFAEAGNQPRALEFLRKALDDGFRDRNRLMGDTEFAKLRTTPEFAQLMAEEKIH
jgi:tetratricopeptide (TPR) repeat protein